MRPIVLKEVRLRESFPVTGIQPDKGPFDAEKHGLRMYLFGDYLFFEVSDPANPKPPRPEGAPLQQVVPATLAQVMTPADHIQLEHLVGDYELGQSDEKTDRFPGPPEPIQGSGGRDERPGVPPVAEPPPGQAEPLQEAGVKAAPDATHVDVVRVELSPEAQAKEAEEVKETEAWIADPRQIDIEKVVHPHPDTIPEQKPEVEQEQEHEPERKHKKHKK